MTLAKVIEFKTQEISSFEQEPQLLGIYHWNEGLRSMHLHEDRLELNFILSGNGTQVVDGELFNTQAGDVLICNSGVLHDDSLMINSQINAWCLAVTNLKLPDLPTNHLVAKNFSPRIPCQSVAEHLAQLYPLIHHYAQQKNGYSIANTLARAVVLIVYKNFQSSSVAVSKENNFIVEKTRRYIQDHYAEDLNIKSLAEMVNANEFYLSHAFKKITHYSPQQYILRRRIGKAQCLLIYTSLSLTEISARVGYDDSNYFSRVFKKIVGMSPRLYRQKWREQSIGSNPSDI